MTHYLVIAPRNGVKTERALPMSDASFWHHLRRHIRRRELL